MLEHACYEITIDLNQKDESVIENNDCTLLLPADFVWLIGSPDYYKYNAV